MKKIVSFVFLAGMLGAFLLTSCGGGGDTGQSPSDIVKAGINAVKDKNMDGVMKYYKKKDGTDFTKEESQKMSMLITMAASKLESKKGLKELVIDEEKIAPDGNSATVKYTMMFNDGTSEKSDVELKKLNGGWFMLIGK